MLEFLLELVFEVILQLFFELLVEFGLRSWWDKAFSITGPWLAAMAYVILGAILGWLSLFIFPELFIHSDLGRWVNLIVTPLAVGFAMTLLGKWREKRGQELIRLDRFAYGYLLALAFAAARLVFA